MRRLIYCLLPLAFLPLTCTNVSTQEQSQGSGQVDHGPGQDELDSLNSFRLNAMEFRRFDKDRDGLVSRTEYEDLTGNMNRVHQTDSAEDTGNGFTILDQDGDQFLTLREFRFNFVRDTIRWPYGSSPNTVYKKVGDEYLFLDILMPEKQIYEKAPVLFFVHGGGFRSGAKEYLRLNDLRAEVALGFAQNGFCCVSVGYRLVNHDSPGSPILVGDCVTDVWDGLRFLKENAEQFHIDPEKIIVWGESAGGHLVQMLCFSDPEDFQGDPVLKSVNVRPLAGISWYGASDFTASLRLEAGNSAQNRHFRNFTGKNEYSEEDLSTLKELSPVFLVDESDPPLLLMMGDRDHTQHISHTLNMHSRAKEMNAKVELVVVKNAGHNWRQVGDPITPSKNEIKKIMLDYALELVKMEK